MEGLSAQLRRCPRNSTSSCWANPKTAERYSLSLRTSLGLLVRRSFCWVQPSFLPGAVAFLLARGAIEPWSPRAARVCQPHAGWCRSVAVRDARPPRRRNSSWRDKRSARSYRPQSPADNTQLYVTRARRPGSAGADRRAARHQKGDLPSAGLAGRGTALTSRHGDGSLR
jgi:hypothetical protein